MLKAILFVFVGFLPADPAPIYVVPYVPPNVCIGIEMPLHCMVEPWHDELTQTYCS